MQMVDVDDVGMFVHNNSVLAALLDMTGYPIVAVANEYNFATLDGLNTTATKMAEGGMPGAVAYGHMRLPGIEEVVNAFDLQKRHIQQMRSIEIEADMLDVARAVALHAHRLKAVNQLWKKAVPTIRKDTGKKSFILYSANLPKEHMQHLEEQAE